MIAKSLRLAAVPVLTGLLLGGGVVAYRMHRRPPSPTPVGSARDHAAGGALVVSTDRLNFGSVDSSERAVMRQLLLRNTAERPINVLVGDPGSGFSISPQNLSLEPGSIGRVVVTAAPRTGPVHGELRLTTDEVPARPYVVALEAGRTATHTAATDPAQSGVSVSQIAHGDARTEKPAANPGSIVVTRAPANQNPASAAPSVSTQVPAGAQPGVTLTRTNGAPQPADPGSSETARRGAATPPHNVGVVEPRSIAERPSAPLSDDPAEGETPQPLRRPRRDDSRAGSEDDAGKPASQGVSMLSIGAGSSLTLMGTTNQFYPQHLSVLGSSGGGPFSLASAVQVPQIPLAFGQSMQFSQSGSAVGSFDAGSGQVSINLPLQAVDSTGRGAPLVLSLTTGTTVIRNSNGVLVSATGTPRSAAGSLRLVGIGKIPTGYRNGAEEQLVVVEILGTLSMSDPAEAQTASASTGSEL